MKDASFLNDPCQMVIQILFEKDLEDFLILNEKFIKFPPSFSQLSLHFYSQILEVDIYVQIPIIIH